VGGNPRRQSLNKKAAHTKKRRQNGKSQNKGGKEGSFQLSQMKKKGGGGLPRWGGTGLARNEGKKKEKPLTNRGWITYRRNQKKKSLTKIAGGRGVYRKRRGWRGDRDQNKSAKGGLRGKARFCPRYLSSKEGGESSGGKVNLTSSEERRTFVTNWGHRKVRQSGRGGLCQLWKKKRNFLP